MTPIDTPATEDHADIPDIVSVFLDGSGHGRPLEPGEWNALPAEGERQGFVWLHLRSGASETLSVLAGIELDATVIEALTAEETRPRCTVHEDGLLLNLRGVNLNPGAELEDMVSVRFWITSRRVIGVWVRPLFAIDDLRAAIRRGVAPVSPGDFVSKLALRPAVPCSIASQKATAPTP